MTQPITQGGVLGEHPPRRDLDCFSVTAKEQADPAILQHLLYCKPCQNYLKLLENERLAKKEPSLDFADRVVSQAKDPWRVLGKIWQEVVKSLARHPFVGLAIATALLIVLTMGVLSSLPDGRLRGGTVISFYDLHDDLVISGTATSRFRTGDASRFKNMTNRPGATSIYFLDDDDVIGLNKTGRDRFNSVFFLDENGVSWFTSTHPF